MNLITVMVLFIYFTSSDGFFYYHHRPCQEYCYINSPYGIKFGCCNYFVRAGQCPKGCLFEKPWWSLRCITCVEDGNCPMGYKCCEDCDREYKICKPIYYEGLSEATSVPTTEMPNTTPEIKTSPIIEKTTEEIKTTIITKKPTTEVITSITTAETTKMTSTLTTTEVMVPTLV